jgi:drug/metabolite transporter (DMT)-like permease
MWLIITVISYFINAIVALVDKSLLVSSIPNPRVYAFYLGVLSAAILLLAPFIGFSIQVPYETIIFGILSGVTFTYGLYWFYKALGRFETARVVPAIGGLTPLFTFFIIYIFSRGQETFPISTIIAFSLLIFGSVLIVWEKGKFVNLESFKVSLVSAFFLSLSFVFSKYVYNVLPIWQGLMWKGIGCFLIAAVFFVIFPDIKKEVFKKQGKFSSKTAVIFFSNQGMGAVSGFLQNWAIALAPMIYISFINALQGVQYVFLLIVSVILCRKFPNFLKEESFGNSVFVKVFAVLLIIAGLGLLATNKL